MTLQLEPDVAFGCDRYHGVVALAVDDRPFLDTVMRHHRFEARPVPRNHPRLCALSDGLSRAETVAAIQGASGEFQHAHLAVLADPRVLLLTAHADPADGDQPRHQTTAHTHTAPRPGGRTPADQADPDPAIPGAAPTTPRRRRPTTGRF